MRARLRRAALSVTVLSALGALVPPTPASATPTCIIVPVNDAAWVCWEIKEDINGNPQLWTRTEVNGRAAVITWVGLPKDPKDWVKVCISTGPVAPDTCIIRPWP